MIDYEPAFGIGTVDLGINCRGQDFAAKGKPPPPKINGSQKRARREGEIGYPLPGKTGHNLTPNLDIPRKGTGIKPKKKNQ